MYRVAIRFVAGWLALSAAIAEPVWQTVTVPRPDGSEFLATVARPASDAGAPFPTVTFAHGWMAPPFIYNQAVTYLVDHGYAVMLPWSTVELFPDHAAFAEDLRHCLTFLVEANADPASDLFERVDIGALGFTGHSMGGGASLLAAAEDPRVRSVAVIAPALTFPVSVLAVLPRIVVPVNLIAGTDDDFAPFWLHSGSMFLQSTPPTVWTLVRGGSHFGILDFPLPPPFGDDGSLAHEVEHELFQERLRLFLDATLKNDATEWVQKWNNDSRIINVPRL